MHRLRINWPDLLIGSGLAAALTAMGGIATEYARGTQDADLRKCEIAAALLQDETPSPYLDKQTTVRMIHAADARFERCMKE